MTTAPPERVLITGGSGFIGSRLAARLAGQGAEVVSLDRAAPARARAGVTAVVRELGGPLAGALPERIDAVVHLAAHVDPVAPLAELVAVNAGATARLLAYAREAGARAFVYASTGGVYGYREGPIGEDAPPRPIDAYSLTKWQGELLVNGLEWPFAAHVLRLFFPYGPGQRGRLIPGLVERVRAGEPVTVYNGGRNPRLNPIYIDDLLAAFERALARPGAETVNVAGREVLAVRELAERIGALVGRAPVYADVADPLRIDLIADIRRLQAEWGVDPAVGLDEGLRRVVAPGSKPGA
jgi:nucleoside-diphosphate-sugar epimerase